MVGVGYLFGSFPFFFYPLESSYPSQVSRFLWYRGRLYPLISKGKERKRDRQTNRQKEAERKRQREGDKTEIDCRGTLFSKGKEREKETDRGKQRETEKKKNRERKKTKD